MPHNGYRAFNNSSLKKINKTSFESIETLLRYSI